MRVYENFISYRRSETLAEVQNIYYALRKVGSTFCDMQSLDAGRFDEKLCQIIQRCTNYILVLGQHSLDRCEEEKDWLRLEIKTALENEKHIVCVFVGDVAFPETLPDDIDAIRYYNGPKYDYEYFDSFIDSLCARFLVKEGETEISDAERDFLVDGSTLIKYLGSAPIVKIPEGVKVIGPQAFKDRTQITQITLPNSLETIEDQAFERCSNVSDIIFPDALKRVGAKAFMRCYNLSFIGFNDELEEIGEEAFGFCGKIRVVKLGKRVRTISSSAFNHCDKLAVFDVDQENQSYCVLDDILYSKDKKTVVRCPEGYPVDLVTVHEDVEAVAPWCFSSCLNLVDVVLPKHLKSVGAQAFHDCRNIISLTLGDEVAEFDVSALDGWDRGQRVVVSKRFDPRIKYEIDQKINERAELRQDGGAELPAYVMIKTTFESVEEATKMAKLLIKKRYIASAQLDKLNVFYTWNDELCNENEIELSCITRGDLYDKVETFIKQNHSYECCQIICIPIINTSKEFGDWISEQTLG